MPKVSASIDLLWQLACREAIAGRFATIGPEHFCMALMKLAELPAAQIEKLSPNGGKVGEELAQDAQAVRRALAGLGVDSTQGRRKLRAALGRGNAAYDGGEMHRSEKSRALFDEAARLTDEAGSGVMTPSHLLEALTANPTPAIREVLLAGNPGAPDAARLSDLLSRWGTDLTALAAKGELAERTSRVAEARSVLKAVQLPTRKGIFLVSDTVAPVKEVMESLACVARKGGAAPCARHLKVVDLTLKPAPAIPGCPPEQTLQHLLTEVSRVENLVLRISDIQSTREAKEVLAMLRAMSPASGPSWVCRVGREAYTQHIRKDSYWRRAATAIAIQQEIRGGIPNEL